MLSESFVASLLASEKVPASAALRDAGICIHELQPACALRSTFKKSSTGPNGLAVTPTHVFAAQVDKAVVHVYSRLKGNQEATVPFPERIRSIVAAGGPNGDVLVIGTEGGRLILWETCSGRQVSTSPSHLQPVTSLVVDPTSSYVLSASSDATVHVWSLPRILSFSKPASTGSDQTATNSPILTFSNHRRAITALAVGHSSHRNNIAVSTAADNTAIVWDYTTGHVLRTFLLPSTPQSVTLDPADRAFYVGYESGNVQRVDLYETPSSHHTLYDSRLQDTPSQISADRQWNIPIKDSGAATCLALSYDGMTLLSGHQNGAVISWDVGRGKYGSTIADYTRPVTNLHMLSPAGFPQGESKETKYIVHNVIKPRYDPNMTDMSLTSGTVPPHYSVNVQLSDSREDCSGILSEAFRHPSFPPSLIEEGLAELAGQAHGTTATTDNRLPASTNGTDVSQSSTVAALEAEIDSLRKQVAANEAARRETTNEVIQLRSELRHLGDYAHDLQLKHLRSSAARVSARAQKDAEDLKRREAWFEAEKRGQNGDAALLASRAQAEQDSDDEMSQ